MVRPKTARMRRSPYAMLPVFPPFHAGNSVPEPVAVLAAQLGRNAAPEAENPHRVLSGPREQPARERELEAELALVAQDPMRLELLGRRGEDLPAAHEHRDAVGPVLERPLGCPAAEEEQPSVPHLDESAQGARADRRQSALRGADRLPASVADERHRVTASAKLLELARAAGVVDDQHGDVVAAAAERLLRRHRSEARLAAGAERAGRRLDPAVDRDRELLLPSVPPGQPT